MIVLIAILLFFLTFGFLLIFSCVDYLKHQRAWVVTQRLLETRSWLKVKWTGYFKRSNFPDEETTCRTKNTNDGLEIRYIQKLKEKTVGASLLGAEVKKLQEDLNKLAIKFKSLARQNEFLKQNIACLKQSTKEKEESYLKQRKKAEKSHLQEKKKVKALELRAAAREKKCAQKQNTIEKLEKINCDLMREAKKLKKQILINQIENSEVYRDLNIAKQQRRITTSVRLSADTENWREKIDRDITNFQKYKMFRTNHRKDKQILTKLVAWERKRMTDWWSFSPSKIDGLKTENSWMCTRFDQRPVQSYRDLYPTGKDFDDKKRNSRETEKHKGKCGQERKINSTDHRDMLANNRRFDSRSSSTGSLFEQWVAMENEVLQEKTIWDPAMNFYSDQPQAKQEKCNKSSNLQANQQIQIERKLKAKRRRIERHTNQQHHDEIS